MSIKNRLDRLEKQRQQAAPQIDPLEVRKIDYRAGIADGVPSAPGSIPVRFVDTKQEAAHEHKKQA